MSCVGDVYWCLSMWPRLVLWPMFHCPGIQAVYLLDFGLLLSLFHWLTALWSRIQFELWICRCRDLCLNIFRHWSELFFALSYLVLCRYCKYVALVGWVSWVFWDPNPVKSCLFDSNLFLLNSSDKDKPVHSSEYSSTTEMPDYVVWVTLASLQCPIFPQCHPPLTFRAFISF